MGPRANQSLVIRVNEQAADRKPSRREVSARRGPHPQEISSESCNVSKHDTEERSQPLVRIGTHRGPTLSFFISGLATSGPEIPATLAAGLSFIKRPNNPGKGSGCAFPREG